MLLESAQVTPHQIRSWTGLSGQLSARLRNGTADRGVLPKLTPAATWNIENPPFAAGSTFLQSKCMWGTKSALFVTDLGLIHKSLQQTRGLCNSQVHESLQQTRVYAIVSMKTLHL